MTNSAIERFHLLRHREISSRDIANPDSLITSNKHPIAVMSIGVLLIYISFLYGITR